MTGAWDERARLSEAAYVQNPGRGAGDPSPFAVWATRLLRQRAGRREVIELGCGTGRDSAHLAAEGFRPVGVDFSATAIERALERQRTMREPYRSRVSFVHGEALGFLRGRPDESADAVVAHFVYMTWSEPELGALLGELARLLRPGGLHLFSVRDTTDPNATKGSLVAPRTRLGGPHAVPFRYFTKDDLSDLLRPPFQRIEILRAAPEHAFFIADRRIGGPTAPTDAQGAGGLGF